MELNLMGDYYEWYCDWCDTLNVTLIHRVIDGTFHCCACHKQVLCEAGNHGRTNCSIRPQQSSMPDRYPGESPAVA
jgi:hypothetical protein